MPGRVGPALRAYVDSFGGDLDAVPAVIREDQSKAFEIDLPCMAHGRRPTVEHAALADSRMPGPGCMTCCSNWVQRNGRLGRPRLLLCGLGVGGAASALIWNLVMTLSSRPSADTLVPFYVDDGEIIAHGPARLLPPPLRCS